MNENKVMKEQIEELKNKQKAVVINIDNGNHRQSEKI